MKNTKKKQRGRSRKPGRSLFLSAFGWYALIRRKEHETAAGRVFRLMGVQQVPGGKMATVEIKGLVRQ